MIDTEKDDDRHTKVETAMALRRYLDRRIFFASCLELTTILAFFTLSWYLSYNELPPRQIALWHYQVDPNPISVFLPRLIEAASAANVVAFGALAFMATIQLMLFRTTPIVSIVFRLTQIVSTSTGWKVKSAIVEDPVAEETSEPRDSVAQQFGNMFARSLETSFAAQRRPNVLLFVGTFVAIVGLIFFFYTLPTASAGSADIELRVLQVLPRILMLLFIQVLAGFFLRQYRSSMEEFRYYESVLRHRENLYSSYILRKQLNDSSLLVSLAVTVLEAPDFARIAKGDSTTIIEAQKASPNEFEGFGREVIELLKSSKIVKAR